jgi:hypothetical protein
MRTLALAALAAFAMVLGGPAGAATTPRWDGYDVWVDTDSSLDIVTVGIFAPDPPGCSDWVFVWDNQRLVSQGLQGPEFLDPGPQGTAGLAKIGSFAVPPSESGLDFFAIQATTVLGGLFGSRAGPLNGVGENSFRLGTLQTSCSGLWFATSEELQPAFGDMQVRAFEGAADRDLDGVADLEDNCLFRGNPLQEDADSNGIGNACQCGDVSNDGSTNFTDARLIFLGQVPAGDAKCDVNGDGGCNFIDGRLILLGQAGADDQLDQACPAAHELLP